MVPVVVAEPIAVEIEVGDVVAARFIAKSLIEDGRKSCSYLTVTILLAKNQSAEYTDTQSRRCKGSYSHAGVVLPCASCQYGAQANVRNFTEMFVFVGFRLTFSSCS